MSLHNKGNLLKYIGFATGLVGVFVGAFFITEAFLSLPETGQGGFDSPIRPVNMGLGEGENKTEGEISSGDLALEAKDVVAPALSYTAYRVKQGDMIGAIAEEFGLTQDTLISVNNIRQTRLLQIGQYLKIPTMPGILYTVRESGETLSDIAEKYEISLEKCAEVNNLAIDATFSAGATLFLPDAELDWVTRQEINGDLFKRPLKGGYYFSSYYGWRNSPITGVRSFHTGIDMAIAAGTPVYPAMDGEVVAAGWSNVYGNYVQIRHHSGYQTLYGHLKTYYVKKGNFVYTNTVIGEVGSTGQSTGPHLHFTIYKNGNTVNPQNLWN